MRDFAFENEQGGFKFLAKPGRPSGPCLIYFMVFVHLALPGRLFKTLGLFRSLLFVGRWNILMWNLALTEGGVLEFRVVPCCPEDEPGCVP